MFPPCFPTLRSESNQQSSALYGCGVDWIYFQVGPHPLKRKHTEIERKKENNKTKQKSRRRRLAWKKEKEDKDLTLKALSSFFNPFLRFRVIVIQPVFFKYLLYVVTLFCVLSSVCFSLRLQYWTAKIWTTKRYKKEKKKPFLHSAIATSATGMGLPR